MVLISSKKYACETCIKGHRSSACKHTDRPLFEIKKKGRPVTQCEHCRELRKTKQVHVKCICEAKEPVSPPTTAPAKKKGTPAIPAHAAFPHGVPSVAAEGPPSSSDSDDHGGSASGCSCKVTGAECHCCTPRTRPGRRPISITTSNSLPNIHSNIPNNNTSPTLPPTPNTTPTIPSRTPSHHILARIAELRPVLPRPSARDVLLGAGAPQHDLFHPHHAHAHEHFSPYGRAHDFALGGNSTTFYQHDAPSTESLASQRSAPPSTKSTSQKSHSTSASFDGQAAARFFGAPQPIEWRLPPSLTRAASTSYARSAAYARSDADDGFAPPRPRSEDAYPAADDAFTPRLRANEVSRPRSEDDFRMRDESSVFAPPRPRSEDDGRPRFDSSPELRQDDGAFSALGMEMGRTCGCGDGCACPGCALHSDGRGTGSASQHEPSCADAACGGACLDCTILSLTDFSDVVGVRYEGEQAGREGERMALDVGLEGYDAYERAPQEQAGYEFEQEHEERDDREPGPRLELDLDLEGYSAEAYQTLAAYAQIDEWIREVSGGSGAGAGDGVPFDANTVFGEGTAAFGEADGFAEPQQQQQQQFEQPAWVFDAASPTPSANALHGLAPANDALSGSSSSFLTVPGPGAHARSRSSSSASSEVSAPGAVGAGPVGGLADLSLDGRLNPNANAEVNHVAPAMGVGMGMAAFAPPLPAFLDERMLFY